MKKPESPAFEVTDEALRVRSYRIDIRIEANEMRMVFYRQHGQQEPIAVMLVDAAEGYTVAQRILKNYDKLEGIDK